jgi:CRP/FNR family transcriptional regulator
MDKLRQHIEEITPVSDGEFDYIKTFFTIRNVKRHHYLLQAGEKASNEYWVNRGIFRAFFIDHDGREHIVQFALENGWISDYSAFFNQKISCINIICMEDAEVFCLSLFAKEQLASELHKMEHFFRIKLILGYSVQQRRIMSLLSDNPRKRYEEFANMHPGVLQRIPKKYIAEYLGLSRETLSRLYTVEHNRKHPV